MNESFSQLVVSIADDTLELTKSGAISGEMSLHWEAGSFPDSGWYEYITPVLGWWIDSCLGFLSGRSSVKLLFMEGPQFCELSQHDLDGWQARLVKRTRQGDSVVASIDNVDMRAFVLSVREVARAVIDRCREFGWDSHDIRDLNGKILQLDKALARKL